jgi:DNA-binding transcriptional regulator YiaG
MTVTLQQREPLAELKLDELGTSFSVMLVNSAWKVGKDLVIPSQFALYKSLARFRVLDGRKLTGGDIAFLRKTLGFKGKDFASELDITPEYLSRCESGDKVLSSQIEKLLRLFVLSRLLVIAEESAQLTRRALPASTKAKWADDVSYVIGLRITAVSDADVTYEYRLKHCPSDSSEAAKAEHFVPIAIYDEWDRTAAACG